MRRPQIRCLRTLALLIALCALTLQPNVAARAGTRILFVPPRGYGAVTVRSDGADRKNVAATLTIPVWWPAFSADAKGMFFESEGPPGIFEIHSYPFGGGAATRVTHNALYEIAISPSPNGKTLVFVRDKASGPLLYSYRLADATQKRLTRTATNTSPTWSPDGRRLCWIRNGTLWIMRAGGGRRHQVGSGIGVAGAAAWSPAGDTIAYVGQDGASIHEVSVDGSGDTEILSATRAWGTEITGLVWSPDASRIAYTARKYDDVPEVWKTWVYVMRADGSGGRGHRAVRGSAQDWATKDPRRRGSR